MYLIDVACVGNFRCLHSTAQAHQRPTGRGGDDDEVAQYKDWAISVTTILCTAVLYITGNHVYMKYVTAQDSPLMGAREPRS